MSTAMDAISRACDDMEIDTSARALLTPALTAAQAVQVLLQAGHVQAALQLAARLLPKRYVVAWLCQCARGETLAPEARAGAMLAERWLRDPSEGNRRAAYEFATAGGYRSVGAWLAASAGWAEGSLAPAGQSVVVTPPDHLVARAAVAALGLLAAEQPQAFQQRRRGYAEQALALLGAAR
ncbi:MULTISPECIES: hypothetical protein [Stenotrophomonas]|uniref:DUF6931 family protein n=1 Tax=Stenotrophomonas TaxID=40323 RepID=UPI000B786C11|nr:MULTISPECIES: hypothetical protein [Stenotrophomonas]